MEYLLALAFGVAPLAFGLWLNRRFGHRSANAIQPIPKKERPKKTHVGPGPSEPTARLNAEPKPDGANPAVDVDLPLSLRVPTGKKPPAHPTVLSALAEPSPPVDLTRVPSLKTVPNRADQQVPDERKAASNPVFDKRPSKGQPVFVHPAHFKRKRTVKSS
jgi:hypothetical protein